MSRVERERERERQRERERERDRERLLNISLITRKNNQSFLVVIGVFLHGLMVNGIKQSKQFFFCLTKHVFIQM